MLERVLIEEGRRFVVIALRTRPGQPTLYDKFVDGLPEADQKKLDRAVSRLADRGMPSNPQKGRSLRGHTNLNEIKEPGLRVLWFTSGERTRDGRGIAVLTHGLKKKSERTPRREIDRAERMKQLYIKMYVDQS